MNEFERELFLSLWKVAKKILTKAGVYSTNSELYRRVMYFEDEFYSIANPPKSKLEEPVDSIQQLKAKIAEIIKKFDNTSASELLSGAGYDALDNVRQLISR